MANNGYACYCGSVAGMGDCLVDGKADGPCREVIENAAETTVAQTIVSGQSDPFVAKAAGAAMAMLSTCELGPLPNGNPVVCADSCVAGLTPDAGQGADTAGAGGTAGTGEAARPAHGSRRDGRRR